MHDYRFLLKKSKEHSELKRVRDINNQKRIREIRRIREKRLRDIEKR
jgi:hypothetical protein